MPTPESELSGLVDALSSARPAPASGSAAAATTALAAALLEKVARLSAKHWADAARAQKRAHALRLRSEELIQLDSLAYLEFVHATRSGRGVDAARQKTIDVPMAIAGSAARVIDLARDLETNGNPNLRADAAAAAILAQAAATTAEMLVRVNESARPQASRDRAGGPGRAPARSRGSDRPSPPHTARGDRSKPAVRRPESLRSRSASAGSQSTRPARRRGESR
ncbi:MAG: cyclodeaminase/cyclohydrolase family protein [Chloroflexi bacterium]|nr:MAG: cyclodeaminase/cyclohydrolase family protein [Chloroflexota bacterium]TME53366.1 MAG: cyclodeaminase/cyclohydrolase family protein [Chloroflexota bacterium]